MEILKFTYNPFQENTFIIIDEDKNGVIIDPGAYMPEEKEHLLKIINEKGINLQAILGTHAHLDHILGNSFIKEKFNIDYYLHKEDVPVLEAGERSAELYGFNNYIPSPHPDRFLEDGQILKFGKIELKVIFTPGHAPGHVVFYIESEKAVINGDVLFAGSYGRVDLPGGDFNQLYDSITKKMFQLPEDTIVHTGHGPSTSIGREKRSNPILMGA